MPDENIEWSPREWVLAEFCENLQVRLRQLEPNRPILTDQINGDTVYVRRVAMNRFQCGISVHRAAA